MINSIAQQRKTIIFFLGPSVLLMILFFIGPIIMTLYFSFTNMALVGSASTAYHFVGFKNFADMFMDPGFRNSILKTIIFLVFSAVIGQQLLGFILAYLMRGKNKNIRRVIGISVLAGWVTPEIVGAFIWVSFLNYDGTLNKILSNFGFHPVAWLFAFPMVSIIIANIWKGTAFSMMVFEAALGDIPKDVEEAALMDGANWFHKIRFIVIPMLKNTVVTNMILVTLQTIGMFGLIWAMTGGGPGGATSVLPIFMYKQAFVSYQIGYGTAISLFILLIGICASLLYVKLLKSEI